MFQDEEEEITARGVYIGDLKNNPQLVRVLEVPELDAAELLDDNDYLQDDVDIPVSVDESEPEPTNPRFSISAVSGVRTIPPSERTAPRPSYPANELYRRVWCCADEE